MTLIKKRKQNSDGDYQTKKASGSLKADTKAWGNSATSNIEFTKPSEIYLHSEAAFLGLQKEVRHKK